MSSLTAVYVQNACLNIEKDQLNYVIMSTEVSPRQLLAHSLLHLLLKTSTSLIKVTTG